MENQERVWDSIAPEWNEFKENCDDRIVEFLKGEDIKKVLDVGCASGRYFIKSDFDLYGVDFSEEMLNLAKKNATKKGIKFKGDKVNLECDKLPYEDGYFDRIICIAVLHCLTSKKGRLHALNEIKRVLKKDGKCLIKVWNRNSKRFKGKEEKIVKWRDKGGRYYYFYTKELLESDLKNSGFKLLNIKDKNSNGFDSQEIIAIVGV